jgi:hypothetical protein
VADLIPASVREAFFAGEIMHPKPRHAIRAAAFGAAALLSACTSGNPRPEHAPSPLSNGPGAAEARAIVDRLAAEYDGADGGARRGEVAQVYPRLRAELAAAREQGTAKKLGGIADQLRRGMKDSER